ncbi:MAG: GNAT superfamily N-acetyltransferase [Planctomycetota bacterium]|jgi:GNAT superfamily N-acetyltransferase
MELQIRPVTDFNEALGLVDELDRLTAVTVAEYRDTPLASGCSKRILDRHFEQSTCLLLLAEDASDKSRLGICLIAPFEDPLTGELTPVVVLLHVENEIRHRGVARALVKNAITILGERGHSALAARAAHNDDALISMGERWGFLRQWEFMVHE